MKKKPTLQTDEPARRQAPFKTARMARSHPKDEREELRSRLLQLEFERRKRPRDEVLLREMIEIADRLEYGDHATEYLESIERIRRDDPRAMGDILPDRGKDGGPLEWASTGFLNVLLEVVGYPSRGQGRTILIGGGFSLGVAFWFLTRIRIGQGAVVMPVGGLFALILSGYLWGYAYKVINAAAAGRREPPEWQDWKNLIDSAVLPLLSTLALFSLTFGPSVFVLFLIWPSLAPLNLALVVLLFLAGAYTAPMMVLIYAYFGSLKVCVDYRFVFAQIRKILPEYILTLIGISVLIEMQALVGWGLFLLVGRLPLVGELFLFLVGSVFALYAGFIACYLLGQIYDRNADALGWTQEGPSPAGD